MHLFLGDSGEKLASIIASIDEPITFWLDAHNDNELLEFGKNTPILRELEAIKSHPIKTHTLLIDDVRLFNTTTFDNIALSTILRKIYEINPKYRITFEDGFVPAENLVGGVEGEGMAQAQQVFGYTRLMVAAFGLGGGLAALDRAVDYAKERVQAGSPLIEKQAYTHKLLVPHAVRLEAARAYIEEVARRVDEGTSELNVEGAIAKLIATEYGNAAADAAIQALGGYGYMKEYDVEKIRRDVRITTIYEGTSEIMEWTIARDRWRDHLQTRGQYYAQVAPGLDQLHARAPNVGADIAAQVADFVASGAGSFAALKHFLSTAHIARGHRSE